MIELVVKDFRFTKKILLFTLVYCIAVPVVLLADNDAKYSLADLLLPLVLITAPMSKMMQMEDKGSGIIFRKTLPFSSMQIVGARFLFGLLLLGMSEIMLALVKTLIFKTEDLGSSFNHSGMMLLGFSIYFAFFMAAYYWKGFFATQFCVYALVVVALLGKKMVSSQTMQALKEIISSKSKLFFMILAIWGISFLLCSYLESRRKLD